jgi:hypothetical protein
LIPDNTTIHHLQLLPLFPFLFVSVSLYGNNSTFVSRPSSLLSALADIGHIEIKMKFLYYLLPAMALAAPLLERSPEPQSGMQLINDRSPQETATVILEDRSPKSKSKPKPKPKPKPIPMPKPKVSAFSSFAVNPSSTRVKVSYDE